MAASAVHDCVVQETHDQQPLAEAEGPALVRLHGFLSVGHTSSKQEPRHSVRYQLDGTSKPSQAQRQPSISTSLLPHTSAAIAPAAAVAAAAPTPEATRSAPAATTAAVPVWAGQLDPPAVPRCRCSVISQGPGVSLRKAAAGHGDTWLLLQSQGRIDGRPAAPELTAVNR